MGQRSVADFNRDLALGLKFEAMVDDFLTSQGFPIGRHTAKEDQWKFGESSAHVEIKLDRDYILTGNLFIEKKERRTTDGFSSWRPAGIYDDPRPWFYCIGDECSLWLLPSAILIRADLSAKYPTVGNRTNTSFGMLFPIDKANIVAVRRWLNWTRK